MVKANGSSFKTSPQVSPAVRQAPDSATSMSEGRATSGQPSVSVVVPKAKPTPLEGLEVTEFEATLPIEIYGELFTDRGNGAES